MNPVDNTLLQQLIAASNTVGANPDYVRAGGGNSSVKIDGVLYIKPSGTQLATLRGDDLVGLRVDVLLDALHSDEPVEGDPVQAAAAAALVGTPTRRPSVEILFHALIDDPLVLHVHPLVVNAVTCGSDGAALAGRLFGDDAVWVPYVDPGVPLARAIESARTAHVERTGQPAPALTLLGNHGIIVSGSTQAELVQRLEHATEVVAEAIGATPEPDVAQPDPVRDAAVINAVAPRLRALLSASAPVVLVAGLGEPFASLDAASPLVSDGPLIPDQIVYAGSFPLVIDASDAETAAAAVEPALAAYRAAHGRDPVVTLLPGIGVLAVGADRAKALTARDVFGDSVVVAGYADRLGGVRVMDDAERGFIETWEAEAYRKAQAAPAASGRLAGTVAMVTGAAQGFGLGIAEQLLVAGASVVLADLNVDGARAHADRLSGLHGAGRAEAVRIDVSDEASCFAAVAEAVTLFGGIDLFVSNAGIARAGSVFEQSAADFDLVTNVNYRGYFLGVRAVAPIMAAAHQADPSRWSDIVEINSKSGLEGSKRNFAYAGSKFGGIGLTQSFALELVEDGIKVNAVCPGNYLDGPLWSDPERGLFVQYLNAGKVPGARSVADVRAYYESKVPMGRGCTPVDVAKAVVYVVEQSYETGQAIPVTGGQNMLH